MNRETKCNRCGDNYGCSFSIWNWLKCFLGKHEWEPLVTNIRRQCQHCKIVQYRTPGHWVAPDDGWHGE